MADRSLFTREQRDAWYETTKDSPFNQWLRAECNRRDGTLDLPRLHALAERYGVDPRKYEYLNPGQQRMNIGNRLRAIVPSSVYESGDKARWPGVDTQRAARLPIEAPAGSPSSGQTAINLLRQYGAALDELRSLGVVRTSNAPLGDYAEHLFAEAFGWTLACNSGAGHDAVDAQGARYQIKARRVVTEVRGERQLSILRRLAEDTFDQLAAVLFRRDFIVLRAAIIPRDLVRARATHIAHVNGWRFILDDSIWLLPGVQDVTAPLRDVQIRQS